MGMEFNKRRAAISAGTLAVIGIASVVTLTALSSGSAATRSKTGATQSVAAAKKATGIPLLDGSGRTQTLAQAGGKNATVVVFLGTECPVANGYSEPLSKMAAAYEARGVRFVGVNANAGETLSQMAKHAEEYRLSFPVLKDEKGQVADALGARVTPEAFILDAQGKVRYHGRISDQYASRTEKRAQVKREDLRLALDAVLAGKPVAQETTTAIGCAISRKGTAVAGNGLTYHKDIAPIFQERCQSCHRPGQVAPFSLLSYADAKNWATEIKTFTQNRQMPPWQAEPGHGEFQDVRRMTDAEVATVTRWVDSGAPEGSASEAPAPKQWSSDWMLGKPDLVLTMPEEFNVEANGEDVFRCFVLPTNLPEDKQVVAVEMRPGNNRVVHHVLNFLDTTGKGRALDAKDPAPGYDSGPGGIGFFPSGTLSGWAPGNFPRFLPKGVGMALPKGSDVVIQMHYHKTGKPEKDRTSIGLYFAKEPVEKQLRVLPLTNLNIRIPANEARHELKATMRIPWDISALSITPHMHLLGKEMKVTATFPDGTKQSLLWVKNWDYRWQDNFEYKEPMKLPKGTQLDMVAYFDNSAGNARNPNNPPKLVTFGEQTTDEMCFAFFRYTRDQEPAGSKGGGGFGLFGSRPAQGGGDRQAAAQRPALNRLVRFLRDR